MKQREITFNNMTFNGKRWQWLCFLIMDINDFLGQPFCFVLGDNVTVKNFEFDMEKIKKGSTKHEFAKIVWKHQEKNEQK